MKFIIVIGAVAIMLAIMLNVPTQPKDVQKLDTLCPTGLAEQAAQKDADYKKSQADFEAFRKESR